ncbi:hypothetical protein [Streptomyces sp. SID1034]|uniref:hypothetical protein n=1 Tax=Streptomyces sp. SID1034 TaxID=2690248 RepID=UPI0013679E4A|nr:hypothetical protein [Streptomyces sp. SID1034]MYV95976.1 hypothetical protein [Streptomyces sp. SID1034]
MATPTVEYTAALKSDFSHPEHPLLERLREALIAEEWPDERAASVRVNRRRLSEAVETLSYVPSPTPALAEALWKARQMGRILPADPDCPTVKYTAAVARRLDELLAHRVAAAAYTCTSERGDLTPLYEHLGREAGERAGELRFGYGDRGMHALALPHRPGWRRVQNLVQDRLIGLLIVASADELVSSGQPQEPGWDRQIIEAWLGSCGIRLVCLDDRLPAGGDAR